MQAREKVSLSGSSSSLCQLEIDQHLPQEIQTQHLGFLASLASFLTARESLVSRGRTHVLLYRVRDQGHGDPGAQTVLKASTGLPTDNGYHLARLQCCDKGTKLRVGGMVRVRDDVDIRMGAVDFSACGKDSNGRVGLVPTQHVGMADLHMAYGMDAASRLLHREHICQAQ